MLTKPKQIVLDKSAFNAYTYVRRGFDQLCQFSKDHILLLSDTLLYECVTAEKNKKQDPADLLTKCQRLIKEGAYYCDCSVWYAQWEGMHLTPYPRFLPNLDATDKIRTDKVRLEDACHSSAVDSVFFSRSEVARQQLIELSEELKDNLDSEHPDVGKIIAKGMPADSQERLRQQLDGIDPWDMCQKGVCRLIPDDWIKDKTRFCLSDQWMSWHYIRLTLTVVRDYHYLREKGGPPGKNRAEHDWQDMEYVLLLSRADAIITRDQKLVEPLARVAFLEKDVFSSLEEVPESYRCDWTNP